jgi:hypothetical protein
LVGHLRLDGQGRMFFFEKKNQKKFHESTLSPSGKAEAE